MYDMNKVEKYLRKRDRKNTAEKNKQERRDNNESLVKNQAQILFKNIQEVDLSIEKVIDRQARLVQEKLMQKKTSDQTVFGLLEKHNEAGQQYFILLCFYMTWQASA